MALFFVCLDALIGDLGAGINMKYVHEKMCERFVGENCMDVFC